MKKLFFLFLFSPIAAFALGKPENSELLVLYGILLGFLGAWFGIEKGIYWLKEFLHKRKLHKQLEENTSTNPPSDFSGGYNS
ncbi:MAG: hypothetical protein Q8M15_15585 [Bacteroidota bacterium]|nr:hypothetical protein [Bacteroidota bacterium]